ncbi:MAG TPA: serpin family protein [Anaerolineae bacterium]|nr:serpin family protein [Anaerolineae bacterium]HOQ97971.1 serpin family protein [Anaerolineae bacterium]HPL27477.1 serpin family protein [Anaerolineae bacterium]
MKNRTFRWLLLALALGVMVAPLAGCAVGVAKADVVKSDKARLQSPDAADVPDLVAGNTQFALDLYGVLYDKGANLFCSPYSISQALAMTYAGAKGATAQEMAQALAFTLPQERLHPAFNALDQVLASRGANVAKDQGERFSLHVTNALWGQQDYAFLPAFLDVLAENYGAGLRLLDLKGASDASRQTINRWVEEQTAEKIKDLLPEGSIDSLTRLVLTNAIYFNAGWKNPFQAQATQEGAFHLLDGSSVTVPMMRQGERMGYVAGQGWQAVELPYVGDELSMVVVLPAEGQFEAVARGLDAATLATMTQGLKPTDVALALPRFKFEAKAELKEALVKLGMAQAFSQDADFSGMTERPELYIDQVYHKAFVAVDEKGTEAAAATAVAMRVTAAPAEPKQVRVDRPFIFLIRDAETGAILFLGHVVNPAQ